MQVQVVEQVRLQTLDRGVVYPELGEILNMQKEYADRVIEAGHVVPFRLLEPQVTVEKATEPPESQEATTATEPEAAEAKTTEPSNKWIRFREALRGADVPTDLIDLLIHYNLTTLERLSAAKDVEILQIRGIATATLRKIRTVAPQEG